VNPLGVEERNEHAKTGLPLIGPGEHARLSAVADGLLIRRDGVGRREEPPRDEAGFRAHGSNQRFHRLLRHAVARALTTAPSLAGVSPAAVDILILHWWRRKGPPGTLSRKPQPPIIPTRSGSIGESVGAVPGVPGRRYLGQLRGNTQAALLRREDIPCPALPFPLVSCSDAVRVAVPAAPNRDSCVCWCQQAPRCPETPISSDVARNVMIRAPRICRSVYPMIGQRRWAASSSSVRCMSLVTAS
jgi:hypothetical protein